MESSDNFFSLRNRLLIIAFVYAAFEGIRIALVGTQVHGTLLSALIAGTLSSVLCSIDAAERGYPLPHAAKWVLFFTWPVTGSIYLLFGRGLRRFGWGALTLACILFTFSVSFFASRVVFAVVETIAATRAQPVEEANLELLHEAASLVSPPETVGPIPIHGLSRAEMHEEIYRRSPPLTGSSSFATRQDDGTDIFVKQTELFFRNRDHVFVFHDIDGTCFYLDDFEWSYEQPPIREVKLDGDEVVYFTFDDKVIRRTVRPTTE